jgi:hypothetical protein
MFRYRLRTLLILLAVGPPVLAVAWWGYGRWRTQRAGWGHLPVETIQADPTWDRRYVFKDGKRVIYP